MTDKLQPIKGYFKIDRIVDGEVTDTFENNNTIMARVPQVFAGMVSGNYIEDLQQHVIGCFSIGTGGLRKDAQNNDVPKSITDTRNMLFSEYDFWNSPTVEAEGGTPVNINNKRVYQASFNAVPNGDLGNNISFLTPFEVINEGSTIPHTDWIPDNYRGIARAIASGDPADGVTGSVSVQQNVVTYEILVGQFAANDDNDLAIPYSEAGLYMKYGSDILNIGNPLGTLFSMKTFPALMKNSTCSLKITWKLYF